MQRRGGEGDRGIKREGRGGRQRYKERGAGRATEVSRKRGGEGDRGIKREGRKRVEGSVGEREGMGEGGKERD